MTVWADYASRIRCTFNAKECSLLIVDVQVCFCSPTGTTARKHANSSMQALPTKINAFVAKFKRLGGLPIYIKSVPSEDCVSDNEKWLNQLKGITRPNSKQDPELELYGLDIAADAIIIEKPSDGFAHTPLKDTLVAHGIKNVLICGVRTEICVRRIAERSASEGYLTFVLEDLCATRDANQDHAEQALMFLNAYTGVVLDSERMRTLLVGS